MAVDALLTAAERLFAERGAYVSLRDIAIAGGHRNNSAVHYHFGDRQGLIGAIVRRRLTSVEATAARLLTTAEDRDTHTLTDILVHALLEATKQQGATHYFRFLEVMRSQVKIWPADEGSAWSTITQALAQQLRNGTEYERASRISSMATTLFALLADYERSQEETGVLESLGPTPGQIVEMVVALLQAPMQPQ
ncbi:TetR/AcrR family transcriptional regulator [Rhodococcus sp. H29-C3]|uniref:TetR/AcrR family transcriptional regulator n=1 Tax=Rhodococcus sp. H29-C3 TaxID=3046307 RepID=UPI0024BBC656|nr:TetR/AcrR family transcriptional regulator [Rhodococcus sp. H29-C3]MDJ0363478.1 TetR/AcrR family transcriptional regulator [Rhodococcus sp. H29-C3]